MSRAHYVVILMSILQKRDMNSQTYHEMKLLKLIDATFNPVLMSLYSKNRVFRAVLSTITIGYSEVLIMKHFFQHCCQ